MDGVQTVLFWAKVNTANNWKRWDWNMVSQAAVEAGSVHSSGHYGSGKQAEHKMLIGYRKEVFLVLYGD